MNNSGGDIIYEKLTEHVVLIRLNRPQRKNAMTLDMFADISKALQRAEEDISVKIVAITGNGSYFSSGNDLSNFLQSEDADIDTGIEEGAKVFKKFVESLIVFPKILIGLVNGPAIGIMVTTLPLYDVVYCSSQATFYTPFSKLGQCLEGASSYTFPRIMPRGAAMEMLCFDCKLTAQQAKLRGLVTDVFPHSEFQRESLTRLNTFSTWPRTTLIATKKLTRNETEKELMLQANEAEVRELKKLWKSEECLEAVMTFFMSKNSKI